MEETKRDIRQKLINSANALAAAADAMLEAAEDIADLEDEIKALENYFLDQEKLRQKIIKTLAGNEAST
jgi:type II secretory pathway component PulF